MHVLQLELLPRDDWREAVVAIRINGESLLDRVARLETAQRISRGLPLQPTRYDWAEARRLLLPRQHLLGPPAISYWDGFSELLVCTCGESGCGAIAVSIRSMPRHIAWLAWRQLPLNETPQLDFPALLFARPQYEAELSRVSEQYRAERPRESPDT